VPCQAFSEIDLTQHGGKLALLNCFIGERGRRAQKKRRKRRENTKGGFHRRHSSKQDGEMVRGMATKTN
jgi:hypothetical protein